MTVCEEREEYVRPTDCEHVEPEEFLRRATSRARLERTIDNAAGFTGLVDPETGTQVVVESHKLDRFRLLPR